MAWPKAAVTAMWETLGKTLALEPAVPSEEHTYFGMQSENHQHRREAGPGENRAVHSIAHSEIRPIN